MSVKVYNFDNFKKEETTGKKTVTAYVLFADFDAEISKRDLELRKARCEIEMLRKTLRDLKGFLENAPLKADVCCCGGSTNCNPLTDGHSFVDQGEYAISQWIESLNNLDEEIQQKVKEVVG